MGDQAQSGTLPGAMPIRGDRSFRERASSGEARRRLRWRDDLAQVVEAEIIPRLMLAHRGEPRPRRASARVAGSDDVARLAAVMLAPEDRDGVAEIRALLDDGMPAEEILTGCWRPPPATSAGCGRRMPATSSR